MQKLKKTVIITGASSGVGLAATKILAATNHWFIIMACRNKVKAELARATIPVGVENTIIMVLDLADFDSIFFFVKNLENINIDVLACNAGVQTSNPLNFWKRNTSNDNQRTKQGFEVTLGTNHIGHVLLTKLVIDKMIVSDSTQQTYNKRIIYTSSELHNLRRQKKNTMGVTLGNMSGLAMGFQLPVTMIDNETYNSMQAYKISKLCNVMTTFELAKQLSFKKLKINCNCFSPGFIPTTGLFNLSPFFQWIFSFLMKRVLNIGVDESEAGKRLAFMISDESLDEVTGTYYAADKSGNFGRALASIEAQDVNAQQKLWKLTNELLSKFT